MGWGGKVRTGEKQVKVIDRTLMSSRLFARDGILRRHSAHTPWLTIPHHGPCIRHVSYHFPIYGKCYGK